LDVCQRRSQPLLTFLQIVCPGPNFHTFFSVKMAKAATLFLLTISEQKIFQSESMLLKCIAREVS